MTSFIILGAALGSLATWAVCKYFYDERRRHYLRDTTALMQRSMEGQDRFHATHAMLYLDALRALESGDSESAKRDLASGAAGFYHQFSGPDQHSRQIESQKREIEFHAKISDVLRAALDRKPNDNAT
jgi:CHASE2 domain-containing sensor protein